MRAVDCGQLYDANLACQRASQDLPITCAAKYLVALQDRMEKNDIEKKLHAGGITDEEENFAINVSSLITKDVNTVLVSAIGKAGVTFCYWSEPVVIHKSEIPAPVKIFKPDFALTDER